MSRLYLITGFLGAGKTTFLRRFVSLFRGDKVRLIVNEFGQEGIDGTLLADLNAIMKEISGGSVFCSCRLDQFEAALQQCGDDETILVEASGLSDPTGVRRLFGQTDRFPHIQYMGGICLADAIRFPKVHATTRTVVRQIAASDVVLLNKIDKATPEQVNLARDIIQDQRPDMPIIETSFGRIPENFLDILRDSQNGDPEGLPGIMDLTNKRITVKLSPEISAYQLEMFIRMFSENTFRVKGLIPTRDKGVVLADCVENVVNVTPYEGSVPQEVLGELTVLSGAKMPIRKALATARQWYEDYVLS